MYFGYQITNNGFVVMHPLLLFLFILRREMAKRVMALESPISPEKSKIDILDSHLQNGEWSKLIKDFCSDDSARPHQAIGLLIHQSTDSSFWKYIHGAFSDETSPVVQEIIFKEIATNVVSETLFQRKDELKWLAVVRDICQACYKSKTTIYLVSSMLENDSKLINIFVIKTLLRKEFLDHVLVVIKRRTHDLYNECCTLMVRICLCIKMISRLVPNFPKIRSVAIYNPPYILDLIEKKEIYSRVSPLSSDRKWFFICWFFFDDFSIDFHANVSLDLTGNENVLMNGVRYLLMNGRLDKLMAITNNKTCHQFVKDNLTTLYNEIVVASSKSLTSNELSVFSSVGLLRKEDDDIGKMRQIIKHISHSYECEDGKIKEFLFLFDQFMDLIQEDVSIFDDDLTSLLKTISEKQLKRGSVYWLTELCSIGNEIPRIGTIISNLSAGGVFYFTNQINNSLFSIVGNDCLFKSLNQVVPHFMSSISKEIWFITFENFLNDPCIGSNIDIASEVIEQFKPHLFNAMTRCEPKCLELMAQKFVFDQLSVVATSESFAKTMIDVVTADLDGFLSRLYYVKNDLALYNPKIFQDLVCTDAYYRKLKGTLYEIKGNMFPDFAIDVIRCIEDEIPLSTKALVELLSTCDQDQTRVFVEEIVKVSRDRNLEFDYKAFIKDFSVANNLRMTDSFHVLGSCPVCLENYTCREILDESVVDLLCSHTFCMYCIKEWCKSEDNTHLTCPLCRRDINSLNAKFMDFYRVLKVTRV